MPSNPDSEEDSFDERHLTVEEHQAHRVPWEIQELASVAILSSLALLAITNIASAWAMTGADSGTPTHRWSTFLVYSTDWSGLFAGFILLTTLGLVWWQTDGWADRLEDLDIGAEGQESLSDFEEAIQHLVRNRSLSTACGIFLIFGLLASVGSVVGEAIVGYGGFGQASVFWSQLLRPIGELIGFLILATIGGLAIVRLRSTYSDALNVEPESLAVDESMG
jgi:hypothetical protein